MWVQEANFIFLQQDMPKYLKQILYHYLNPYYLLEKMLHVLPTLSQLTLIQHCGVGTITPLHREKLRHREVI